MDISDGTILALIAGGGTLIGALATRLYNNLLFRIKALEARCEHLEQKNELLESRNAELEKENAELHVLATQLRACPVQHCHWRVAMQQQTPPLKPEVSPT